MMIFLYLMAAIGTVLVFILLAPLLFSLGYTVAATISFSRCLYQAGRINGHHVAFLPLVGSILVKYTSDFMRYPRRTVSMGGPAFEWKGVGQWTVQKEPTSIPGAAEASATL